jgi:hypothetical protein
LSVNQGVIARFDIRKTILLAGYQGEVPRQCYDGCHFFGAVIGGFEMPLSKHARSLARETLLTQMEIRRQQRRDVVEVNERVCIRTASAG